MDELASIRREVTHGQVEAKIAEFRSTFNVSPECDTFELERAAKTSVALDLLVEKHDLGSMAYYYEVPPAASTRTSPHP